ncbi:GGDEF domain-containing protein [Maribrevibacterium harenarium]|uniref:diguanylate cyclase n=1 Tax=Maribrevibacterium harenarium TaxID=2589817 RepID=A0A501WPW9_9GAMM|nr:GGDEF domain-containing protein [Maribrevibacterium harenarium]TPE50902.1 GGDEF domain-containing protein [Maribrevibacterium harenarium]
MESITSAASRVRAFIRSVLFAGTQAEDLSSSSRRIFIINLFCMVGVTFTFPLGVLALFSGRWGMGIGLLALAALYTANHFFLRRTQNHVLSSNVILYPLYLLMLYLVYSGGVNGTGHVWIYCLPAVSLFLHGLKRGLLELFLFLLLLLFVLYGMETPFDQLGFHPDLKSRVVLSFVLVILLSTVYEYITSLFNHSLQEAHNKVALAATTDPLTGLLNRRGLQNTLADRNWSQPYLLLLDVDHFKRINDQYGHDAGDLFLCQMAENLQQTLPKAAALSRWGGEEFLIACQCESASKAMAFAEALRGRLADLKVLWDEQEIATTISIGMVQMKQAEKFSEALGRADKQLYQAKAAGRNHVCLDWHG